MRKLIAALTFITISLAGFSQDRKDLAVSFSAGVLNSPYYKKADAGGYYSFDFGYHLAKRQIISASYLAGQHRYYDDVSSNAPNSYLYPDGTNAEASYNIFSVSYRYKIVNLDHFDLTAGAGAGIMTHTREFPYVYGNSSSFNTSSWSDLVFPVSLSADYKLSQKWQLGLQGGFYVHPDYPLLAFHAGPKLSYILK